MKRSGTADLPLHGGRVPQWLAQRMARLGAGICEALLEEHGHRGLLARLSDPYWFQALGCVLGMDWHSSGITTSVMGALKRGLAGRQHSLGIYICGGRGRHSRRTPQELMRVADRQGLAGDELVRASRLSAKVDNTCVQDGFSNYLHCFVLTNAGDWAVVQQGMNPAQRLARRYHWLSASVRSFVEQPHAAIVGDHRGLITNLVDRRSAPARAAITELVTESAARQQGQLRQLRQLTMPGHHDVRPQQVDAKRLGAVLALAHELQASSFEQALLTPGLGPRTMQSLALVAELVHGAPSRFSDPARFSFAHGGKDGHPFPVPLAVYDQTIATLESALGRAQLAAAERDAALGRLRALDRQRPLANLHRLAEQVEQQLQPEADVAATIAAERAAAPRFGGRTVTSSPDQLELFDQDAATAGS